MDKRTEIRNLLLICGGLALATVAAFWPVRNAEFVNLDDPVYVVNNLIVQRGLTLENVKWAFTTFHFSNWHPLTWLSYMLDCEVFGVSAPAMHFVNLFFHIVNSVLLLLAFRRMTGALLASAMVAGLFALHPLHVESVAWISERKDVLSGLFWILTMWVYAEYTKRRCAGCYVGALVLFALGLMSKPMLVTLPCVLLLLDFWPLRRIDFGEQRWWARLPRLVLEKLPFFVLSAVSSYLAFIAQRYGESVIPFVKLPLSQRLENAVVSYARYIAKTVWPGDLAVYYPHPTEWPGVYVIGALMMLVLLSVFAILVKRRSPYVFTGWFWFVGTLVPVIGIIQVGGQSMADRYSYIPSVGLFMAVVWGIRELALTKRLPAPVLIGTAVAVVIACSLASYFQTRYWQNSLALFSHAAEVTAPNVVVLNNFGDALRIRGKTGEARQQFQQALQVDPDDSWAWGNLGAILFTEGKLDQALVHYENALRTKPNSPELHYNIGLVFAAKGEHRQAIRKFDEALAWNPLYLDAYLNRGVAYDALGDADAAATNYLAAVSLNPRFPAAQYNLGHLRLRQSRLDDAIKYFSEALSLDPTLKDARRQLAVALVKANKPREARHHFERLIAADSGDTFARLQLAVVLEELGETERAIAEYRAILRIDPNAVGALNNLAWTLATHPEAAFRNGAEAVQLAERAIDLASSKETFLFGTLGAAYAEVGRLDDAMTTARKAIGLAEERGTREIAEKNRQLLKSYENRQPWREPQRIPKVKSSNFF